MKEKEPEKWTELEEKAERNDILPDGMLDSMMRDVIYPEEELIGKIG